MTVVCIIAIFAASILAVIMLLGMLLMKKKDPDRDVPWVIWFAILVALADIVFVNTHYIKQITNIPIVVETVGQPQIDTTIVHFSDGTADTTYTYTFPNTVIE